MIPLLSVLLALPLAAPQGRVVKVDGTAVSGNITAAQLDGIVVSGASEDQTIEPADVLSVSLGSGGMLAEAQSFLEAALRTANRLEHDAEKWEAIAAESREADIQMVLAVREGDTTAYRGLVEKYQTRVYQLIYGMVRNQEDARDLAQDAFVKAYDNLHRFRLDSISNSEIFYNCRNTE